MPNNKADDRYQTELCIRVWKSLIRDFLPEPQYHLFDTWFNQCSLAELVSYGIEASDALIRDLNLSTLTAGNKFRAIIKEYRHNPVPEKMRRYLQLTRFAKRFTPCSRSMSTESFWQTNQRLASLVWNPHNFLVSEVRDTLRTMLTDYSVDWEEWELTSGATYDRDKSLEEKLLRAEKVFPSLLGLTLPTPYDNISGCATGVMTHGNRMKAVPKNFFKSRHIAIEPEWINVKAQPVANAIRRCLPAYAPIHDQMHNFNLAKRASVDNSLATIDLSSASDSVSRNLCAILLPTPVMRDIESVVSWCESTRKRKDGSVAGHRYYSMVSTMGNRVTFPLETLIFSAIVCTAARLAGVHPTPKSFGIYGDDIIVPTPLADSVISMLEYFGFIVNKDKTFCGDEFFRESCGGEFYKGVPVATRYWPRRELTGKGLMDYPVLIALQHKFYALPYTNDTIVSEVRKIFPKVTESYPDSPYDDIWTEDPLIKKVFGSYAEGGFEKEPSCELHTVISVAKRKGVPTETAMRYYYYRHLRYGHVPHEEPILASLGYPAEKDIVGFSAAPAEKVRNKKFLV